MTHNLHKETLVSHRSDHSSWSRALHAAAISLSSCSCRLLVLLSIAFCSSLSSASLYGQAAESAASATAPQAASATASPMTGQAMLYPGDDFQLGAGDLISVHVFLQADYQATVRVDADGNVKLPFIGSVNLKGQTVREAQALIANRLQSEGFYTNPEVILQVLDTVNGSVTVTGEVRAIVPVSTQRSLKDVLLTAGGLPPNASHTVKIVRAGTPDPIVVELGTDLATSQTANIAVRPHDIIQISRASVVYVLGAFTHQGSVPLDQSSPLSLLQLAALSGGIGFEGKFNDLRLIRTVGNDRKVIEVDIKKVRNGEARDPILQANDIVFLPTSIMKAALKSTGANGIVSFASLLLTIRSF